MNRDRGVCGCVGVCVYTICCTQKAIYFVLHWHWALALALVGVNGVGNEKNVVVVVCNTNQQRAHPYGTGRTPNSAPPRKSELPE